MGHTPQPPVGKHKSCARPLAWIYPMLEELAASLVMTCSTGVPALGCLLPTVAASMEVDALVVNSRSVVRVPSGRQIRLHCRLYRAQHRLRRHEGQPSPSVIDAEARPDPTTLVRATTQGDAMVRAATDIVNRSPSP